MFPRAVIGSLVASVALLSPSAAQATSGASTTTVVSRAGLPAGFALADVDSGPDTCTGAAGAASATHVTGPSPAPLGHGSLQLSFDQGAELADSFTASASALTSFSLSTSGSPEASHAVILALNPIGTGYQLTSALPMGGWTTTNVLDDANMIWWFRSQPAASWDPNGTGTYAQFLAADPGVQLSGVAVTADTCSTGSAAETVNLDNLRVGLGSATTVYDFEVPLKSDTLVNQPSRRSTVSGAPVTPKATFGQGGKPIAKASVSLWQKPAGTTKLRKVGTVKTNSHGVAVGPIQHPARTTSYQWRFATDGVFASAVSTNRTVRVASAVSLHLINSSVAAGGSVGATGVVTPKHAGIRVTLWRTKGHGKVKLATKKLHADGTYTVATKLAAGHYTLFATVSADKTNTAGASAKRKVTVEG